MTARTAVRHLTAATVSIVTLLFADARAAPNIHSEGTDTSGQAARLSLSLPKAGLYRPGDKITIRWRKTTPGKDVELYLYSATTAGLRQKKVQTISVPASVSSRFTSSGGAISWKIPATLSPGRYVIVVKAKLDIAASDAFAVQAATSAGGAAPGGGPTLGPSQLEAAGTVVKTDVRDRGKRGSVVLKTAAGEVTYEWGTGACPQLLYGLPGALATMAAIGNVVVEPRARRVTQNGTVLQRCIDGLAVKSGLPAGAVPGAGSDGG
jgi:hypothetical protein